MKLPQSEGRLPGKKTLSKKSYQLFIAEDEASRDVKEAVFCSYLLFSLMSFWKNRGFFGSACSRCHGVHRSDLAYRISL